MHQSALEQFNAGIEICTEKTNHDLLEKGTLLRCSGTSYRELGNIDLALQYHKEAWC